jgi:hypothetical protein
VPADGSASSQHLIDQRLKAPRIFGNSPSYLIPMTFRNQTARGSAAARIASHCFNLQNPTPANALHGT